jgi:phenylacetate-coenzyme A ligase PaaK-like adenylate-forming protein
MYRMIPLSVRYGKVYTDWMKLLEKSQWWSREELETYQWQKLKSLLNHAYQNVPYYRRMFDEMGLKPADIQNLDDFRQIPFLTKEVVRDNFGDLIARNYPKSKRLGVTTGGSTGDPLRLVYEKGVSRPRDWAFFHQLWHRAGYTFGDKMAVFEHIVVSTSNGSRFWAYDPTKNRLLFSIYHMTDGNLPSYIEQVRRFGPKFIHTFPSSLALLARFMKLNSIAPFPSVKAILCASENLHADQRDLFEEVFDCRVFDCYGQVELVVLSGGCEKQNAHHIFPEYGLTELIDERGSSVQEKEGGQGEIVGTGFGNWLMPLIRYRTGDLAVFTNAQCPCGRAYPLLSRIEGRMQEFFIARGGALIPLLGNYDIAAKMLDKIRELQFVQKQEGAVIVNTVKEPTCSESEVRKELLGRLKRRSGGLLDFEVRFVPRVRRTKRGKLKLLVQNLPADRGKQRSLSDSAFAP